MADELTAFDLLVEGSIPSELNGWYLRNGPNPRQSTQHWFTGDGMIHGVRLENGHAAWYRNRWVRTESFDNPFPVYNADGTRNLHSSVANTHVVRHAGKTLALVESSLPYEITNDLQTLGAYDFGGKLVDSMTAHPKICPTTGELHFFGYGNIFAPHVTYHRADANGELTIMLVLKLRGGRRCLYLRLCEILTEMADEFFSSSWRIYNCTIVQDSHCANSACRSTNTLLFLRTWL